MTCNHLPNTSHITVLYSLLSTQRKYHVQPPCPRCVVSVSVNKASKGHAFLSSELLPGSHVHYKAQAVAWQNLAVGLGPH